MKTALKVFLAGALLLQAASFDAASIKPSDASPSNSGIDTERGLLRAHNVTLKRCIVGAYNIPGAQILGGPKWLDELRYDIIARADQPDGDHELMGMLQTLLAERFQLKLHHETQPLAGYALTVVKGGIKAKESAPNQGSSTSSSRGRIEAIGAPMSRLIIRLSAALGAPVSDETALTGRYDFVLEYVPDDVLAKSAASAEAPSGPSLFTAIQEQLGLKLEAKKVPVEVLVIDGAVPPSEN